jgi:hypothetical protein
MSRMILAASLICFSVMGAVFAAPWRFVIIGDTHTSTDSIGVVNSGDSIRVLKEMVPFFIADSAQLVLIVGDIVDAGLGINAANLRKQLLEWRTIMQPLYQKGIGVYPIRGNHEADANGNIAVWNAIFTGAFALPGNGPAGEVNLTYSFSHKNALFIGLDNYVTDHVHEVNQAWLDRQLSANAQPHVFVFGHEAAFKVFHDDCLDDSMAGRTLFWQSLADAGAKAYFCGHDHFYDCSRIDDGDGEPGNDLYQMLVGGGGGFLMPNFRYNGSNAPYTPVNVYHNVKFGYVLAEVGGEGDSDRNVSLTWKERTYDSVTSAFTYAATSEVLSYTVAGRKAAASFPPADDGRPNESVAYSNSTHSLWLTIARAGRVALAVYRLNGRRTATLVDADCPAGTYRFSVPAQDCAAGVYMLSGRIGPVAVRQTFLVSMRRR